jgi:hypothetical protein
MGIELRWGNHPITITAKAVRRYLWLATETIVMVDGESVIRTGGFNSVERGSATFRNYDQICTVESEVKASLHSMRWVSYTLKVNGAILGEGLLPIEGLLSMLLACIVFFMMILLVPVTLIVIAIP